MLDIEHHWFYGTKRPSAYATAELLQQEFWWQRLYETYVACVRAERPHLLRGYWKGHVFDLELEPRKSLICRSDAELPWVHKTLTRSLRCKPAFRYQDGEDRYVLEWWVEGREARWQAMQGKPEFKNLARLNIK